MSVLGSLRGLAHTLQSQTFFSTGYLHTSANTRWDPPAAPLLPYSSPGFAKCCQTTWIFWQYTRQVWNPQNSCPPLISMESLLLFEVRFSISKVDTLECSPGTPLTPPRGCPARAAGSVAAGATGARGTLCLAAVACLSSVLNSLQSLFWT